MPEHADHFGPDVAAIYDATVAERFDPALVDATVAVLARLAAGGPVLELGIGTGRIALPLAARGIEVRGIDLSPSMVQELRAKPGGADLPVTIGDFATTVVGGGFTLAYLVFNTIQNLVTQDAQAACFATVARQLAPGGRFVVESGVPKLTKLVAGERYRVFDVSPGHLGVDEYDLATQGLVSHHHWVVDGRAVSVSMPFRYVWPSELDLMARLAGLRLESRWAGWRGEPFTADSDGHVSVYVSGGAPSGA